MPKLVRWAAVVAAVWFLIAQPHKAAEGIRRLANGLESAVDALSVFIRGLP